ncbi:MAG: ABC transporter permease [Desulfofustis sp.]|jgi:simple sugar transport system permease protein|nr:ABC transporter permease [Desulfofustis sp.]
MNGPASSLREKFLHGSLAITLMSILFGFLLGGVILLVAGFNPLEAYWVIVEGVFSRPKYISYVIIYSTPLIITGLSVAFALRTGLFNIGAEGQYIMGALTAAAAGYYLKLPILLHVTAAVGLAVLVAGLWGGLAGWFKARFGVNEVISTIMLNWTALYISNWAITIPSFGRQGTGKTYEIQPSAQIDILGEWKRTPEGIAFLREHPMLWDILKSPVNLGFICALILAFAVWYTLNRTTLGYELRAVGYNPHAAEAGGIDVKRSIVVSMLISGALAGAAGAFQVLGVSHRIATLAIMEGYGFDGIAVSLIGNNSGPGCVFAGLLFGGLKYGGSKIQDVMGAPTEVINIMIGIIIFFVAMPKLIRLILNFRERRRRT